MCVLFSQSFVNIDKATNKSTHELTCVHFIQLVKYVFFFFFKNKDTFYSICAYMLIVIT